MSSRGALHSVYYAWYLGASEAVQGSGSFELASDIREREQAFAPYVRYAGG